MSRRARAEQLPVEGVGDVVVVADHRAVAQQRMPAAARTVLDVGHVRRRQRVGPARTHGEHGHARERRRHAAKPPRRREHVLEVASSRTSSSPVTNARASPIWFGACRTWPSAAAERTGAAGSAAVDAAVPEAQRHGEILQPDCGERLTGGMREPRPAGERPEGVGLACIGNQFIARA